MRDLGIISHTKSQHHDLPESFKIFVWNVNKKNGTRAKEYLKTVCKDEFAICLFQEFCLPKKGTEPYEELENTSLIFAPNLRRRKFLCGVATTSQYNIARPQKIITKKRELRLTTRKVSLITEHTLHNQETLTIINIHAINFVNPKAFRFELERIKQVASMIQGPLIIAGDFNSWHKKRTSFLISDFCKDLELKIVGIRDAHNVKKFFNQHLDHIFYRDLELIDSGTDNTKKLSDHNPLYATFRPLSQK